MAEKNNLSILETIKKKLGKLEAKSEKSSKMAEAGAEFEYITPPTKPASASDEMEKFLNDGEGQNNLTASDELNLDDFKENAATSMPAAPTTQQEQLPPAHEDSMTLESLESEMAQPSLENQPAEEHHEEPQELSVEASAAIEETDVEDYEDEVDFEGETPESESQDHDEEGVVEPQTPTQDEELTFNEEEDELKFDEEENNDPLNLDNPDDSQFAAAPEMDTAPIAEAAPQVEIPAALQNNDELDFSDILNDSENETLPPLSQEAKVTTQATPAPIPPKTPPLNSEENEYDIELEELDRELAKQQELTHHEEPKKEVTSNDIDLEFEQEFAQPEAEMTEQNQPEIMPQMAINETVSHVPPQVNEPVVENEENDDLDFEMPPVQAPITQLPQQQFFAPDMTKNRTETRILSDETISQTSDSIRKLVDAKNVVAGISNFSQSPALAELATHMLEPKLEKWLNEHLGELVEKIVREEIKKIIPKE